MAFTIWNGSEQPAGGCGDWYGDLWLGEQSAEITDVSDETNVIATGLAAPSHCLVEMDLPVRHRFTLHPCTMIHGQVHYMHLFQILVL